MTLQERAQKIIEDGPSRTMVSHDYALPPQRALMEYLAASDIVFIRDDGWSLSASSCLAYDAEKLWADRWVGVLHLPERRVETYVEYKGKKG